MRHSSRQKHLKHLHRSAHIRRMCYFRSIHYADVHNSLPQASENQVTPLEVISTDIQHTK
ncbi:MAG: hypothetical protein ACI8SK_000032 [Shewanella sp.]|jgi:hypothetical protein